MATEYRINMKRYNGTDYDIMYPRTLIEQVTNGQRQIIVASVSLGTSWTGAGPYTQVVTIDGVDSDSKIDLQPDADVINKLMESGTTALYIVNDSGVATAVALGAAPTAALEIQCTITKTAAAPPPALNSVLNENSWSAIKWASKNNVGQNYWAVGDCKQITMNGKVSDGLTLSNYSAWVYIIGFNHNSEKEGTGITFQGFKTAQTGGTDICLTDSGYNTGYTSGIWFNMNDANTNTGGWQASLMRKNVMPLIKAVFPSDLQAVIKPSTIFTTQGSGDGACTATEDDVFLLAEYEVFGKRTYASTQEPNYLKQYAYYSSGNSKVKYRHNATGSATHWWERSPNSAYSDNFCRVSTGGSAGTNVAKYSFGVSPCFKV